MSSPMPAVPVGRPAPSNSELQFHEISRREPSRSRSGASRWVIGRPAAIAAWKRLCCPASSGGTQTSAHIRPATSSRRQPVTCSNSGLTSVIRPSMSVNTAISRSPETISRSWRSDQRSASSASFDAVTSIATPWIMSGSPFAPCRTTA